MNNYTIQTYKKNETIYCEGETPSHLMCLISGKVKIFKDGVGGRSQIIRMIKPREYFAYRAYFAKQDFVTAAAAFEPSVVCLIPMHLRRTHCQSDTKAYPRTLGRISHLPERKLRLGRRRIYFEHLSFTRRFS